MCGIAGVFGGTNLNELKLMTDALVHRGPDGEGHWVCEQNGIGLGHRRLSIIELSEAGKQPMELDGGKFQISFNGEIYNYLELKSELEHEGHSFKTKTDTEVLLRAYSHWGANCLSRIDGMFAFAIWDNQKKELFCARDRFGEKPFFYTIKNGKFYFASEMKALWAV